MIQPHSLLVTAAIIVRDSKILIGKRKHGQFADKWEFPGGKVEPDETPEDCLKRELMEELGVEARIGNFYTSSLYAYSHATVHLVCYCAELGSDNFTLQDHSEVRWVSIEDLDKYDFPEADRPVVEKLQEDEKLRR